MYDQKPAFVYVLFDLKGRKYCHITDIEWTQTKIDDRVNEGKEVRVGRKQHEQSIDDAIRQTIKKPIVVFKPTPLEAGP